jgi:sec-independent protein translocase protein TatA
MQMPFFLNIGAGELVVIVLFVLLFFGSKSIPDLARTLGRGMREIKNASDAVKREISDSVKATDDDLQQRRRTIEEEYRRTLDQIEGEDKSNHSTDSTKNKLPE